jgi:hypothetical protein
MSTPPAWSFSSIKVFDTCPKKYESEKITKEVGYQETEATLYGTQLHLAAEEYIRDSKDIDPRFKFIKPYLDKLNDIPGEKLCELKLGVKKNGTGRLEYCDFFDPSVWFRGVADLVILDGSKAWIIDYKSGKSAKYADIKQLALMAAALFLKHPEIKKIKTSLLFVVSKEFIKQDFEVEKGLDIFATYHDLLTQREKAYNTGVFNAKPNGLCRQWCGTLSCPHNGRNK